MSEALGDRRQVLAVFEHQGRVGMPKIVEPLPAGSYYSPTDKAESVALGTHRDGPRPVGAVRTSRRPSPAEVAQSPQPEVIHAAREWCRSLNPATRADVPGEAAIAALGDFEHRFANGIRTED